MRTELECRLNLFSTCPRNYHAVVSIRLDTLDSQIGFGKRLRKAGIWSGSNQFQGSMERSCVSLKESVRQRMMKQEQIFKQQVCELHRLYKVQKILMAEIRKEANLNSFRCTTPGEITDTKNEFWNSASTSAISHSSYTSIRYTSVDQLSSEDIFLQLCNTRAGQSSRELSICSEDPSRKQNAMSLKHPKEKTSIDGLELCSVGENDVDLTLSIGYGTDKKKSMATHWKT